MTKVDESDKHKPVDFSTLPEIMEHFFRVPFPQFKSDLDDWFMKNIKETDGLAALDKEQRIEIGNQFLAAAKKLFDAAEQEPLK